MQRFELSAENPNFALTAGLILADNGLVLLAEQGVLLQCIGECKIEFPLLPTILTPTDRPVRISACKTNTPRAPMIK